MRSDPYTPQLKSFFLVAGFGEHCALQIYVVVNKPCPRLSSAWLSPRCATTVNAQLHASKGLGILIFLSLLPGLLHLSFKTLWPWSSRTLHLFCFKIRIYIPGLSFLFFLWRVEIEKYKQIICWMQNCFICGKTSIHLWLILCCNEL